MADRQDPAPDGGESDEDMAARVLAALGDIADRHHDGRGLVVTSGGPIRAVQARLRGVEQAAARDLVETVPNCTLLEVVVRDGEWSRDTAGSQDRVPA